MQLLAVFRPLGIDLFCLGKKFLVFNLVSRNLKIKYHRSALGLLWTLLNPLAITGIFYFVFKVVLNVQIPHYLSFILSGMLPWSFFNQTIVEGMEAIVANLGLITKVPISVQIFPFVGAVTNLITLTLALPILIGTAVFTGVPLGPSLILILYYFGSLFLIAYGLALALAILFVMFRDLRHIMGIVMQIWMYGTPIIYQETMIPDKYKFILYLNPVAFIFVDLHSILVRGEWPVFQHLLIISGWTFVIIMTAALIHKKFGYDLAERI